MVEEYCPDCESPMVRTKIDYEQKIGDKFLFIPGVEAFVCSNEQCGNRYITEKGSELIDNAYRRCFVKPKVTLKMQRKLTTIGKDKLGLYFPADIIRSYNSVNDKKLTKGTRLDLWIEDNRIIVEPA